MMFFEDLLMKVGNEAVWPLRTSPFLSPNFLSDQLFCLTRNCGLAPSRKALAAVCAADIYGHSALSSFMQGFGKWPALFAAQTAASALRLEGR